MLLQFNSMCVLGGTTSYTGQMFCEALFYTSHLIVFSWQISSSTMKVYYSVTQTRYKFTNKPKRVLHCVCSHSVHDVQKCQDFSLFFPFTFTLIHRKTLYKNIRVIHIHCALFVRFSQRLAPIYLFPFTFRQPLLFIWLF